MGRLVLPDDVVNQQGEVGCRYFRVPSLVGSQGRLDKNHQFLFWQFDARYQLAAIA